MTDRALSYEISLLTNKMAFNQVNPRDALALLEVYRRQTDEGSLEGTFGVREDSSHDHQASDHESIEQARVERSASPGVDSGGEETDVVPEDEDDDHADEAGSIGARQASQCHTPATVGCLRRGDAASQRPR